MDPPVPSNWVGQPALEVRPLFPVEVKCEDETFVIDDVSSFFKVADLKLLIGGYKKLPIEALQVSYEGKPLDDIRLLAEYSIDKAASVDCATKALPDVDMPSPVIAEATPTPWRKPYQGCVPTPDGSAIQTAPGVLNSFETITVYITKNPSNAGATVAVATEGAQFLPIDCGDVAYNRGTRSIQIAPPASGWPAGSRVKVNGWFSDTASMESGTWELEYRVLATHLAPTDTIAIRVGRLGPGVCLPLRQLWSAHDIIDVPLNLLRSMNESKEESKAERPEGSVPVEVLPPLPGGNSRPELHYIGGYDAFLFVAAANREVRIADLAALKPGDLVILRPRVVFLDIRYEAVDVETNEVVKTVLLRPGVRPTGGPPVLSEYSFNIRRFLRAAQATPYTLPQASVRLATSIVSGSQTEALRDEEVESGDFTCRAKGAVLTMNVKEFVVLDLCDKRGDIPFDFSMLGPDGKKKRKMRKGEGESDWMEEPPRMFYREPEEEVPRKRSRIVPKTYRCALCGRLGHNKRTCPQKHSAAATAAAVAAAAANSSSQLMAALQDTSQESEE